MKQRIILHIDINHCYAQMEEARFPELKNVPMCVGGSEKTRTGIVLARNTLAKKQGVTTAESLRESFWKCPELVVIEPDFDYYIYLSEAIKDIYRDYTDRVESFGIDEAWLDLSHTYHLFGSDPLDVAKKIQTRIYNEFGLTVSVGFSDNKIFAKLASDYQKPNGFTVMTQENMNDIVWPLPCEDLLYIGPSTKRKLNDQFIFTIGDIANQTPASLEAVLGSIGSMLWNFANGLDTSEVNPEIPTAKSIGNGITTIVDMMTYDEAKLVFFVLIESICARMTKAGLSATTISIKLRNNQLKTISRQKKLSHPTHRMEDIIPVVLELLYKNYNFDIPLRSVSVTGMNLVKSDDIDNDGIDNVVQDIKQKYGHDVIKRANMLLRKDLTSFNPQKEHSIYSGGKRE